MRVATLALCALAAAGCGAVQEQITTGHIYDACRTATDRDRPFYEMNHVEAGYAVGRGLDATFLLEALDAEEVESLIGYRPAPTYGERVLVAKTTLTLLHRAPPLAVNEPSLEGEDNWWRQASRNGPFLNRQLFGTPPPPEHLFRCSTRRRSGIGRGVLGAFSMLLNLPVAIGTAGQAAPFDLAGPAPRARTSCVRRDTPEVREWLATPSVQAATKLSELISRDRSDRNAYAGRSTSFHVTLAHTQTVPEGLQTVPRSADGEPPDRIAAYLRAYWLPDEPVWEIPEYGRRPAELCSLPMRIRIPLPPGPTMLARIRAAFPDGPRRIGDVVVE